MFSPFACVQQDDAIFNTNEDAEIDSILEEGLKMKKKLKQMTKQLESSETLHIQERAILEKEFRELDLHYKKANSDQETQHLFDLTGLRDVKDR